MSGRRDEAHMPQRSEESSHHFPPNKRRTSTVPRPQVSVVGSHQEVSVGAGTGSPQPRRHLSPMRRSSVIRRTSVIPKVEEPKHDTKVQDHLQHLEACIAEIKCELQVISKSSNLQEGALGVILEKLEQQHGPSPPCRSFCAAGTSVSHGAPEVLNENAHVPTADPAPSLLAVDPEVKQLLQSDGALQQLLHQLKKAQGVAKAARRTSRWDRLDGFVMHPDGRFRSAWNVLIVILLMFTCVVVPVRIAFPMTFGENDDNLWNPTGWNIFDIFIEWVFVIGVVLNFFTGYHRDGQLVMKVPRIARVYLLGWFWVDAFSSIPVDTIGALAQGARDYPVLRLNKVSRVLRLYKVVGILRRSKWAQRRLDPAMMKLFELIFFLVLAWHYIGCIWWYVGESYRRPIAERLRVLDATMFTEMTELEDGEPLLNDTTMHYLSGFYWAVMMTTGLNVAIGPGLREGQILYECVITFFGVCLQAYMLGTATSEIANMDAQDTARRQTLKAIKQHLRALRVPQYLKTPIMEYYERATSTSESADSDVFKEMPSTLKVQLAVTLNAEFLRSVSFFSNLDGTISAALVLCMRPRVCMPGETIIHQGDISPALFFIRSGTCDVIKSEGLMPPSLRSSSAPGGGDDRRSIADDRRSIGGEDGCGTVVTTLNEYACFGEQSFMSQKPALATVRSNGFTTLMRIYKTEFDMVVAMFPKLRVHMLGVQREQMIGYTLPSFKARQKSLLGGLLRQGTRNFATLKTKSTMLMNAKRLTDSFRSSDRATGRTTRTDWRSSNPSPDLTSGESGGEGRLHGRGGSASVIPYPVASPNGEAMPEEAQYKQLSITSVLPLENSADESKAVVVERGRETPALTPAY
eukprot:CAMPEP_0174696820 /NCGR_PEP_ID=MMETSP1094-20130205/2876_1 /TAXON_ID=156173 /ORGANISM="Chrysochromulina brevifilum, Strain UTEX LB 985" /LENGTH=860 /DNA_ID=CAMNT_0015893685 /DNA_START=37 /DNA_END=2619 /DNA_ORIENTATION=-